MDTAVLNDKGVFPTEAIIFGHIGKHKPLWISLFGFLHATYPHFTENWNYYLDGKRWLLKVSQKTKTVFWLSLFERSFRLTFYFNTKYDLLITDSTLPAEVIDRYQSTTLINKIRPITILVTNKKDIETIKTLIEIKLLLK